ncbi:MAG: dihydroorotase [Planctomycetes bacterium]|nr:dihydroorotase [Planctomycetota bacterium]
MLNVTSHRAILIRGGRIIDPGLRRDETADLAVVEGRIAAAAPQAAQVIDAAGLIVCPGLMDIHVHLREPGHAHKETIASGTAAAAAGGFTFVACMPNTNPAIDEPQVVRWVIEEAARVGHCTVGPVAAITRGRAGKQLTDFPALREAGAVAFSDDGVGVEDDVVMRAAFESASRTGAVLIQHCEFNTISAGGVMHLGEVSRRLGLPGLDPRSEEAMIERDLDLCRATGGRYHVAHISTRRAVELVRAAKAEGLPVTAEVTPHHLILTHEACGAADPNSKMHPPLRTTNDVQACREGLQDGTIDCVATDHAPHAASEKARGFLTAPPGVVGLETAVGVTAKAIPEAATADWSALIRWFTVNPARVLSLACPHTDVGSFANLTLLDARERWTVDSASFLSQARNTPFQSWELPVRAVGTVVGEQVRLSIPG